MRVGDVCVFIRYKRQIRPGARVFEPGDVIVAVEREDDCRYAFQVITKDRQIVAWLRDTLQPDEYVRVRMAPVIATLPSQAVR